MDSGFERLFGLDAQLLFDVAVEFVLLMILYVCISKLFFKPVRQFLQERQKKIDADQAVADAENQEVIKLKAVYDEKLSEAHKEAEQYLSQSRKLAMKKQDEIIAQAYAEASAIREKANQEISEEKESAKDDVKREMAEVAAAMAGRFVDVPDGFRQALLLEETLKEMGNKTWQN